MQAQSPEITVRHYRYSKARKLGKGATGSVYLGITQTLKKAWTLEPVSKSPSKSSAWRRLTTRSSATCWWRSSVHYRDWNTPTSFAVWMSFRSRAISTSLLNTAHRVPWMSTSNAKVPPSLFRASPITISTRHISWNRQWQYCHCRKWRHPPRSQTIQHSHGGGLS